MDHIYGNFFYIIHLLFFYMVMSMFFYIKKKIQTRSLYTNSSHISDIV